MPQPSNRRLQLIAFGARDPWKKAAPLAWCWRGFALRKVHNLIRRPQKRYARRLVIQTLSFDQYLSYEANYDYST